MRTILSATFIVLSASNFLGCAAADVGEEDLGELHQQLPGGPNVDLAVFHSTTQAWFFDSNGNGTLDASDLIMTGTFGASGDVPLSGYGTTTCGNYGGVIGTWRPSTREFFLDVNDNRVWETGIDRKISGFMPAAAGFTDQPFIWVKAVGHWCEGRVGYFRTPNAGGPGHWYIDNNNNGVWDGTPTDLKYQWGDKGDIAVPLSGGTSTGSRLTVFRSATGEWIKDNGNTVWEGCTIDSCIVFGNPFTQPFGNPNGAGKAVSDGTQRHIDVNGNGVWDGPSETFNFLPNTSVAILF